jgi:hypothetical protein
MRNKDVILHKEESTFRDTRLANPECRDAVGGRVDEWFLGTEPSKGIPSEDVQLIRFVPSDVVEEVTHIEVSLLRNN